MVPAIHVTETDDITTVIQAASTKFLSFKTRGKSKSQPNMGDRVKPAEESEDIRLEVRANLEDVIAADRDKSGSVSELPQQYSARPAADQTLLEQGKIRLTVRQ